MQGVYPLQGLRNLRAPSGRGPLQFMAGSGAIGLSGDDAQQLSSGRIRLEIDQLVALTSHTAPGACDASLGSEGEFRRIASRGVLGHRREPFQVT